MPMSTPEHDIDCTKFPNTTNYSKPPTSLFPGPLIERHLSLPWPAGRGNGPGNVVERSVEGNLVRSFSVPYSLSFRFLFLTDPARLFAQLFPPVCAGFYKMHLDTCTSSSILVKPRMLGLQKYLHLLIPEAVGFFFARPRCRMSNSTKCSFGSRLVTLKNRVLCNFSWPIFHWALD